MEHAHLVGALGTSTEELQQEAQSLEGAILPNGQRYANWLNRKEGSGKDESSIARARRPRTAVQYRPDTKIRAFHAYLKKRFLDGSITSARWFLSPTRSEYPAALR
jgi:hypothetical protein